MHPEDRERSRIVALKCRAGSIDDFPLEFRLRSRDGSWHWILSRGTCLSRDQQGNAQRIQVKKRLEALPVSPKCLSSIGIMLKELITNALKHAFPDRRKGMLELEAYAEDGKLRFSVRDDGEGLPGGRYAKGFGLLMAESLVEQLGGQLRHESSGGTRFHFEPCQNSCS